MLCPQDTRFASLVAKGAAGEARVFTGACSVWISPLRVKNLEKQYMPGKLCRQILELEMHVTGSFNTKK